MTPSEADRELAKLDREVTAEARQLIQRLTQDTEMHNSMRRAAVESALVAQLLKEMHLWSEQHPRAGIKK